MNNAVIVEQQGSIATVNVTNPPVNALSQEVRAGLVDAVLQTEGNSSVLSVVLACAGRTFIAGADIKEFAKPPTEPFLPDVVATIENATKPWVAAIHGSALGGGLEVALGCHYRIADVNAKLGLPEVTLGLIPGAGGTVRLPRCIAMQRAIAMITTGKPVNAAQALQDGLISKVAASNLLEEAVEFAKEVASMSVPAPLAKSPVVDALDQANLNTQLQALERKSRGQKSPVVAFKTLVNGASVDTDTAIAFEREQFLALKSDPQSQALRHIFFAERATAKLAELKDSSARQVQLVAVVGGGTMGAGIAVSALLSGCAVTMVELTEQAAVAGHKKVLSMLEGSVKRGLITHDKYQKIQSLFHVSTDYDALGNSDLVIEAVFEDMAVKKEVFARLNNALKPSAIIASNTSYLDVDELAATITDTSRVLGLHFFSPAHIMKLVEVVKTKTVAMEVLATGISFSKRLGKIPVVAGVCDGFIGNRIMAVYRQEAEYLLEDGAMPADIDTVLRQFGFAMGVFEVQDLAGLDIAWAMRKRRASTSDPSERYVHIADKLCELGRFGQKAGAGWYNYEGGEKAIDPVVTELIESERARKGLNNTPIDQDVIIKRILTAMHNEAQAVLAEGIARNADDIDVVMVNGYGFPRFKGGPMYMHSAIT